MFATFIDIVNKLEIVMEMHLVKDFSTELAEVRVYCLLKLFSLP